MKRSDNTVTKVALVKSLRLPEGDNISPGELPFEQDGLGIFGTGSGGKVEHFNRVVKPKVSH